MSCLSRAAHGQGFLERVIELLTPRWAEQLSLSEELRPCEFRIWFPRTSNSILLLDHPYETSIRVITEAANVFGQIERLMRTMAELVVEVHQTARRKELPESGTGHLASGEISVDVYWHPLDPKQP